MMMVMVMTMTLLTVTEIDYCEVPARHATVIPSRIVRRDTPIIHVPHCLPQSQPQHTHRKATNRQQLRGRVRHSYKCATN